MARPEEEEWDEEIAERMAMNREAWSLLLEKGYKAGQKTRLDFAFVASERADALKLQAFLEAETDYSVKVINNDDEFEIDGQTAEIPLSLEGLNQWVSWLVKEGRKYDCTFDGWIAPLVLKKKE